MKIQRILNSIQNTEKVASAATPTAAPAVAPAPSGLQTALAASVAQAEKVASEVSTDSNPAGDLLKIAADLEAAEKQAALAETELHGRAFMDAAIARYEAWAKTAAAALPAVPSADALAFGKFAAEQPQLLTQAAELGYQTVSESLEKQAAAEYEQGFREQWEQIRTAAAEEFLKAAAVTQMVIEHSRQGA